MESKENKLKSMMLIIALVTLAVFIISFTVFYTEENFSSVCGCRLPIWVIIIAISSFGMFVGSTAYYILNKSILKEKKEIKKSAHKLFELLEAGEKKMLEFIIKKTGEGKDVYQSNVSKECNMDKVKVSRILSKLEKKGVIIREKKGMTNSIKLTNEFKDLF